MPDINKQFYRIREVAEIIGVQPSTLRYWENEFTELSPKRSLSHARRYTTSDIEKLRMIYFLVKVKGLKLEAAKEQMRVNEHNIDRQMGIVSSLEEIKVQMKGLMNALSKRIQDEKFNK